MSLEETKDRLLAVQGNTKDLLTQIHELYIKEIRSEDKFLIYALSELHNSGKINLVAILGTVNRGACGHKFFTILQAFENVLPSLDASVEDVLHCLVHLMHQVGNDLAIGGVFGAFQHFCNLDVDRPRRSIEIILNHSELNVYASFLSNSLLAFQTENISETIKIVETLIAHENNAVRRQAYFTLGHLDVSEALANVIWDFFNVNANRERDSGCCVSLLRAILNFGEKFPYYWPLIEELLITWFNTVSPEVQYEISNVVAFQRIELPENILHLLVNQLTNVSPEHKNIIDNIDHLLVKLVEQNASSCAIDLLEAILAGGVDFPSLNYFSSELLGKHKILLNHIVTKWFLAGESSLCNGVLDLLHGITSKDIELNADMSLLNDETKQVFVCHKAVGWLFMQPIAAASFILSIYKSEELDSRKELERILYDPLLLSYPGELKKYFQECIINNNQTQLCEYLLRELEKHDENLNKTNILKELRAPLENINTYWKYFDRSMQKARDNAPKSIFEDICTVQNLLYGNSSIYYINQGDGEPVRQEMEMQSFSHSTEMPRLNILDPQNLDYMLRVYRRMRMNK